MKKDTTHEKNLSTRFLKAISLLMFVVVLALSLVIFAACDDNGAVRRKTDLIFSDEFTTEEIDVSKWDVHGSAPEEGKPGEVRRGGWWTEDSVFQKQGNLVIRTTYDPEKNTFYTGGIDSKKLFTYGYYEARCKVPEANGIWAAFWLMCNEIFQEIPDARIGGAEIDIFESPYYKLDTQWDGSVQHAIHTAGYGSKKQDHSTVPPIGLKHTESGKNGYAEWHTFALDWQPDYYRFYVDGDLTYETCAPYHSPGDEDYIEKNVSAVPSYIILSVEVGGVGGVPGNSPFLGWSNPIRNNMQLYDMNNFSVDFLVDYVRVWKTNPYM